jgi:hypothetical protein
MIKTRRIGNCLFLFFIFHPHVSGCLLLLIMSSNIVTLRDLPALEEAHGPVRNRTRRTSLRNKRRHSPLIRDSVIAALPPSCRAINETALVDANTADYQVSEIIALRAVDGIKYACLRYTNYPRIIPVELDRDYWKKPSELTDCRAVAMRFASRFTQSYQNSQIMPMVARGEIWIAPELTVGETDDTAIVVDDEETYVKPCDIVGANNNLDRNDPIA